MNNVQFKPEEEIIKVGDLVTSYGDNDVLRVTSIGTRKDARDPEAILYGLKDDVAKRMWMMDRSNLTLATPEELEAHKAKLDAI